MNKAPTAYISRKESYQTGNNSKCIRFYNTGVEIGCNCIINTKALIEHDVIIGNNTHISTGAIINGRV
jgi:UDP-3-O-[3-hydroxymyristoyl] glucosamine N-acyltransferase